MATEIERKFLVYQTGARWAGPGEQIVQGYLHEKGMTTRVRIVDGKQAWLTLKGARSGLGRPEYEYAIPLNDAQELLLQCGERVLSKLRFEVEHRGHVWHVDVYDGALRGLVTAEVELSSDTEPFVLPPWVDAEVTHDKAYTNKRMAINQRVPMRLAA